MRRIRSSIISGCCDHRSNAKAMKGTARSAWKKGPRTTSPRPVNTEQLTVHGADLGCTVA